MTSPVPSLAFALLAATLPFADGETFSLLAIVSMKEEQR